MVRTLRKPKVRKTHWAMNFEASAPTAVMKVDVPDWKGVRPKPSWSISGSRNGMAPMPMRNNEPPMMAVRKSG